MEGRTGKGAFRLGYFLAILVMMVRTTGSVERAVLALCTVNCPLASSMAMGSISAFGVAISR